MTAIHASLNTILVLRHERPSAWGLDQGVPACDPDARGPMITVAIRQTRRPTCPKCIELWDAALATSPVLQ